MGERGRLYRVTGFALVVGVFLVSNVRERLLHGQSWIPTQAVGQLAV